MRHALGIALLLPPLGACTLLFAPDDGEGACSREVPPLCDCGGTSLVFDDFSAEARSPLWTAEGTVEFDGSVAVVATSAQLRTVLAYDLRNDSIEAALVGTNGPGLVAVTLRVFSADVRSYADFQLGPEGLAGIKEGDGAGRVTVFEGVPYDGAEHRFWRIRNDGGVDGELVWETSRDRSRWKVLGRARALAFIPAAYVSLHALGGAGFEASFDDVRGGDRGRVHCPAEVLSDEFSDGPAPPWWNAFGSNSCQPREEEDELVLPGDGCNSTYTTSTAYALEGSSLEVEIPLLPSGPADTGMLHVQSDQQHYVQLLASEGTIELLRADGGAGSNFGDFFSYESGTVWWRLTQLDAVVRVETSDDGSAWVLRGETESPFGAAPVTISLSSYGGAMRVASVNATSR